jgi:hypothetical protein
MTTYTVNFASDAEFASRNFDAETPEQALALARKLYEDEPSELWFESYDGMDVNEILVYDADGNELAVWYDADMHLRLAAQDLLEALEAVCDLPADDTGDRTIPAGFLDQARAAIAKAKGGAA